MRGKGVKQKKYQANFFLHKKWFKNKLCNSFIKENNDTTRGCALQITKKQRGDLSLFSVLSEDHFIIWQTSKRNLKLYKALNNSVSKDMSYTAKHNLQTIKTL